MGKIRSKGYEDSGDKARDKNFNYGSKADKYQDKKYDPPRVKREAAGRKPPA